MNRLNLRFATLGFIICLLTPAWAATNGKVGWIDMQQVLEQAPQAQMIRQQLKTKFAAREQGLRNSQEELRKMQETYQRDAQVMSAEKREQLQNQIVEKKRGLYQQQERLRQEFQASSNQAIQDFTNEVRSVAAELAKKHHYAIILAEGALYTSKDVDLTDLIIKEMKAKKDK